MTVDNSREQYWRKMQERRPDGGSGGGAPPSDLESRIARIEADTEHMKTDLTTIASGISDLTKTMSSVQLDVSKGIGEVKAVFNTLDERSKHHTTKWDVVAILALLMGLIAAVVALTVRFQPMS